MFLFFSYSKRPFRRHHHRSRVCRHTTWPYQYTWAWHWTHPLDRQICFPDKLWPYNCSHLFHQYSPEHSDPKVRIPFRNCLVCSLIDMIQLQIKPIKPKLDMGLFVDLAEFTCFYQFLHDLIIKLFCRSKQNNYLITSCKNW